VAQGFDAAAAELGLPSEPTRRPAFGWRALVLGSDGPISDRVERALVDGQYGVTRQALDVVPESLAVSERPDIAVLVPEVSDRVEQVVSRWTGAGNARPASVLLITPAGVIDPLVLPYAHLDYVVPPERVETELLSFVRALGRSAHTPPAVLVVDPDDRQAAAIKTALEAAGARVDVVAQGSTLRSVLERDSPDLIVTEWRLPDTTGPAVLRFIRFLSGHHLTPVVVYTTQLGDDDRVAAIRAGADDVILKSTPRSQAVKTLLARVERSRHARALAHRDDLTGL
jgi:PleD family two-component response regulator